MTGYTIGRLAQMVPNLFIVSVIVFLVMRVLPGDAVNTILGEGGHISDQQREELEERLGLNRGPFEQYGLWVGDLLQGDLGTSIVSGRDLGPVFWARGKRTAELAAIVLVLAVPLGIMLGVVGAVWRGTLLDTTTRIVAVSGLSVPNFWLGTLIVVLPAFWWAWSPPLSPPSITEDPLGHFTPYLLAAGALGPALVGSMSRLTRTAMIEALSQDYVRTARAKGITEYRVVARHVVRNALLPIVTIIGLDIRFLIGGTIIIEAIFSLAGVGSMLFTAILEKDYVIVQSATILIAVCVLLINLIVDISYGVVDPRVRVGEAR